MDYDKIDVKDIMMELGDKRSCIFKDMIYVPLTPDLIGDIFGLYKNLVLIESLDYRLQGIFRARKDYFQKIFLEWRRRRDSLPQTPNLTGNEYNI